MPNETIGVDIGGTHLRAARISADGTILARARAASTSKPQAVLERLIELIAGINSPAVAGIGIGVPGRVDFAGRKVLSGGYVDLSGIPLASTIESRFGRPTVIDNDATMALVGEAACGAAKGRRNVVMLTIGTGIGGAILDNGKIVRGRAAAGQLGHISVDSKGPPCLCGRRGCVETLSSGTALGRRIAAAGLPPETTAHLLLEHSRAGDSAARTILEAWITPLSIAVDSLVATLDPELVVLGGGLGTEAAQAMAALPALSDWYRSHIAPAQLGNDAGIIGAGLAALKGRAPGRRLVMVNGVPASGKSTVAAQLAAETGWPVLALDTVKEPFLGEIENVDRLSNRALGRASYRAIFALIAAAPPGNTFIVDAWFGFQPRALLEELVEKAGIDDIVEIWCEATASRIADRYRARATERLPGHPGPEYAEELRELARRAGPMALGPVLKVSTDAPVELRLVLNFLDAHRG
jgi:predicted NBD/HSP70 family sugar kinase